MKKLWAVSRGYTDMPVYIITVQSSFVYDFLKTWQMNFMLAKAKTLLSRQFLKC
jgi:hypothetical protein